MEYQVPQFIEIEDKIIGPLTLKQFVYLAGGGGISIIAVFYLPLIAAILIALPVGGLALALAFYRINGKPFVEVLEAAFAYYTKSKLFLWKHEGNSGEGRKEVVAEFAPKERPVARATPRLTGGKLHELAWALDIKTSPKTPAS